MEITWIESGHWSNLGTVNGMQGRLSINPCIVLLNAGVLT